MTTRERYARIRTAHPTIDATRALQWARHECAVDDLASRVEWSTRDEYALLAIATVDGVDIVVYADDERFDWGDIEPTEYERANLEVIGVAVAVEGERDHLAACWGIGYLHGDYEREALSFAIESGYLEIGQTERGERAYWLAREVETIS